MFKSGQTGQNNMDTNITSTTNRKPVLHVGELLECKDHNNNCMMSSFGNNRIIFYEKYENGTGRIHEMTLPEKISVINATQRIAQDGYHIDCIDDLQTVTHEGKRILLKQLDPLSMLRIETFSGQEMANPLFQRQYARIEEIVYSSRN